jgi:protein-S-isoprenylcysteine O-methyltransferase Ste14
MRLVPMFRIGLANHWIFLLLYAAALVWAIAKLPKDRRECLFADPKEKLGGMKKVVLRVGQVMAAAFIVAVSLTPVFGGPAWLEVVGLGLYAAGTVLVLVAIHYFGRSVEGQPTVEGPYRYSRNPQWVGLFLALLGLAVSGASWLLVLAVLVVGVIYHIQIVEEERLCRQKYGPPYEEYLRRVPRYLILR